MIENAKINVETVIIPLNFDIFSLYIFQRMFSVVPRIFSVIWLDRQQYGLKFHK